MTRFPFFFSPVWCVKGKPVYTSPVASVHLGCQVAKAVRKGNYAFSDGIWDNVCESRAGSEAKCQAGFVLSQGELIVGITIMNNP